MVERVTGWEALLSEYLLERAHMPFEWNHQDCMAFVAKLVDLLTGEDFFASFSGYHDEASAQAMLEKHGGPHGIITACLGRGSKHVLMAKRGDVVIVEAPGITGGIVDDTGQRIAVVLQDGLRRLPLTAAKRVWSY